MKKIQLKLVITLALFFGVKQVGYSQLIGGGIGLHAQLSNYNTSAFGFGVNCSLYSIRGVISPQILTYHYTLSIENSEAMGFHEHFLEYSIWTRKGINPLVGLKMINKRGNSIKLLPTVGVNYFSNISLQYSYLVTKNDSPNFLAKHNVSLMFRFSSFQIDLAHMDRKWT